MQVSSFLVYTINNNAQMITANLLAISSLTSKLFKKQFEELLIKYATQNALNKGALYERNHFGQRLYHSQLHSTVAFVLV